MSDIFGFGLGCWKGIDRSGSYCSSSLPAAWPFRSRRTSSRRYLTVRRVSRIGCSRPALAHELIVSLWTPRIWATALDSNNSGICDTPSGRSKDTVTDLGPLGPSSLFNCLSRGSCGERVEMKSNLPPSLDIPTLLQSATVVPLFETKIVTVGTFNKLLPNSLILNPLGKSSK
jgi:hypothetical protein